MAVPRNSLQVSLAQLYDSLDGFGEYQESIVASGSAVALTSNTPANVTSLTVPAGDWFVYGVVGLLPAASTSITNVNGGANTVSATLGGLGKKFAFTQAAVVPGAVGQEYDAPLFKLSVTVPTIIYLVAQATFTVSTLGAYGILSVSRSTVKPIS